MLRGVFNVGERDVAIIHLNGILVIPIACNHHLSMIQFYLGMRGALSVQTAKTVEGVGLGSYISTS